MISYIAPQIVQIQEAQTKAPIPTVLSQANQPVGNHIILSTALGLISVARFTDLKCFTGQLDGDAFLLYRSLGHLAAARWPHHFFASAS